VMETWRALWAQRLRWQRGAVENLGSYGLRPSVMRYWAQQLGIGYGVIAIAAYLLLILVFLLAIDEWVWFPFWIGVGALFVLERVVTVWKGGWRARLLAVTLFPELVFAMFLNVVFVKGSSTSPYAVRPAGSTSSRPPHELPGVDHDLDAGPDGSADARWIPQLGCIPVPRGVRRAQHDHVRRAGDRQDAAQGLLSEWASRRGRRSETRSIHPDDRAGL
jgi:hypothetical protein